MKTFRIRVVDVIGWWLTLAMGCFIGHGWCGCMAVAAAAVLEVVDQRGNPETTVSTTTSTLHWQPRRGLQWMPGHDAPASDQDEDDASVLHTLLRRVLVRWLITGGEFENFNSVIRNVVLNLGDLPTVTQNTLLFTTRIDLTNLVCRDIQIGDIQASYRTVIIQANDGPDSPDTTETNGTSTATADNNDQNHNNSTNTTREQLVLDIKIAPFQMNCEGRYSYTLGQLFGSSGIVTMQTLQNDINLSLAFSAEPSFDERAPHTTDVDQCLADIRVANVEFSAGIERVVANIFQDLMAGLVERQASQALCTDADRMFRFLDDLLDRLNSQLERLSQSDTANTTNTSTTTIMNGTIITVDENVVGDEGGIDPTNTNHNPYWNPLALEQELLLRLPPNTTLIHLRPPPSTTNNDNSTFHGNTTMDDDDNDDEKDQETQITPAENEGRLGKLFRDILYQVDSIFNNTIEDEDGNTDLAINNFLRDAILDEQGRLRIDTNVVLFETPDRVADAKLVLESIRVIGLDTLEIFQPLRTIGNYTLENDFAFRRLAIEAQIKFDLKTSTLPNGLLLSTDELQAEETVIIGMDVTDLDFRAAILLAASLEQLGETRVGSLLFLNRMVPCILQAMVDVGVAGLDVSVSDISEPVMTGINSPGFNRIIRTVIQAAFVMYKPSLLRALPGAFRGPIRDSVNKRLDALQTKEGACEQPVVPEGKEFVDFRELLLKPEESLALGGSGDGSFGDVLPMVKGFLMNRIDSIESDGLPGVNQILVRPLTRAQSGTEGKVMWEKDLFRFELGNVLDDPVFRVELAVGNVSIDNIDTVRFPIALMDPTDDANILDNVFNIGALNRTLDLSFQTSLILEGTSIAKGRVSNELQIDLSLASMELLAKLKAWMSAAALFRFNLADISVISCWLALFQSPPAIPQLPAISFHELTTTLSSLSMNISCARCESPGTSIIPDLVQRLLEPGVTDMYAERLEDIAKSMLEGDSFGRLLSDAVEVGYLRCPSHPLYDADAERPAVRFGFPTLTSKGIDTLIYGGAVLMWSFFLVTIEGQKQANPVQMDPLSAQNAFIPSTEDPPRLLDLTDLGNSTTLGSLADNALNWLNRYLTGKNDEGETQINSIFRSLAGGSFYNLTSDGIRLELNDFAMSIDRIGIMGLDSLTKFSGLEAIAPQTLETRLELDALEIEIDVSAAYENVTDAQQTSTIKFRVENITLHVALFVAIDLNKIGDLPLGSVLSTDTIFSCLISASEGIEVPMLKLTFTDFEGPTFEGLQGDTGTSLDRFLSSTTEIYRQTILDEIPKLVVGPLRTLVSDALNSRTTRPELCKALTAKDSHTYIDFRDLLLSRTQSKEFGGHGDGRYGDLVSWAWRLANRFLLLGSIGDSRSQINTALIAPLTYNQSGVPGTLLFPGPLIDQLVSPVILDARIGLRIDDIFLENLDTIGSPVSLLNPTRDDPFSIINKVSIGVGRPLRMGAQILFLMEDENGSGINNHLHFSLDISNLAIAFTLLLKVYEGSFLSFPLKDITNVNCWLASLANPTLDPRGVRVVNSEIPFGFDLLQSFSDLRLNVSCIQCSSPRISELTALLSTPEGITSAANVANRIMKVVEDLVGGDFLAFVIDRKIMEAKHHCPHSPDHIPGFTGLNFDPFEAIPRDDSTRFLIAVSAVIGILLVAVSTIVLFVKLAVRRRQKMWLASLADEKVRSLWEHQQRLSEYEAKIDASLSSLFLCQDVPVYARVIVPLIICGNIGLFLSGHLSPAASVYGVFTVGGDSFRVDDFFEFSIASGTVNLWVAGGRELAVLILLFSGVWPYAKQLISLFLWFVSPAIVSSKRRLKIYLWLDFLAKWSMVDIFTLLVSLVAFRLIVNSPDVAFLPKDLYRVELLVVPKLGLYANFLAQVVSQISSHFIIHFDRKSVLEAKRRLKKDEQSRYLMDASPESTPQGGAPMASSFEFDSNGFTLVEKEESIGSHVFLRRHRGENEGLVPKRFVSSLILLISFLASICIALGCVIPSFTAEISGLVGLVVESGSGFREDAITKFSLFSMVRMLVQQSSFRSKSGDYLGLGALGLLLVCTVLIIPITQIALLVFHWFRPLHRIHRKRLIVAIEVLEAWQYTEVFVLSVVAGTWQLGSISHYMMNIYCEPLTSLRSLMAQLVYFGLLDKQDAQCFLVEAAPMSGFWLLATGSILLALLNSFVSKAGTQYLMDKDELQLLQSSRNTTTLTSAESMDPDKMRSRIRPADDLFSDRFRWCLYRGIDSVNKSSAAALSSSSNSSSDEDDVEGNGYFPDNHSSDTFLNVTPARGGGEDSSSNGIVSPDLHDSDEESVFMEENPQKIASSNLHTASRSIDQKIVIDGSPRRARLAL